jgi:hypothetical protein
MALFIKSSDSAAFRYQEAIDWLSKNQSLHSVPYLMSSLGEIYQDQNRLRESEDLINRAIDLVFT